MPSIIKRLFGGVDDAHAELTRLREQVERTKAEIATEAARPVPLAEIETRIGATIAALREQAAHLAWAGELARAEGGPVAATLANPQAPAFVAAAAVAPAPLAAWLRELALVAAATMGEPVNAATRAARLAELRGKLAKLERDEAELWWSALDRNLDLPPRADADPAAVLGLDAA